MMYSTKIGINNNNLKSRKCTLRRELEKNLTRNSTKGRGMPRTYVEGVDVEQEHRHNTQLHQPRARACSSLETEVRSNCSNAW